MQLYPWPSHVRLRIRAAAAEEHEDEDENFQALKVVACGGHVGRGDFKVVEGARVPEEELEQPERGVGRGDGEAVHDLVAHPRVDAVRENRHQRDEEQVNAKQDAHLPIDGALLRNFRRRKKDSDYFSLYVPITRSARPRLQYLPRTLHSKP